MTGMSGHQVLRLPSDLISLETESARNRLMRTFDAASSVPPQRSRPASLTLSSN